MKESYFVPKDQPVACEKDIVDLFVGRGGG